MATFVFKRTEKKYLLTKEQYVALKKQIDAMLFPDKYPKSTVCSLYLDTPDYRMIRSSIDATTYKEKLRVRCYGVPKVEDIVFLEIKKKYRGVVYKRREALSLEEVMRYLSCGILPRNTQIMKEIDYSWHMWQMPQPTALVAYEREAFFIAEDPVVRLTFDRNVRYRTDTLLLTKGHDGRCILPSDQVLLEIKTAGAMPLFLSRALDVCHIYPASFSKYGRAYIEFSGLGALSQLKGEYCYV